MIEKSKQWCEGIIVAIIISIIIEMLIPDGKNKKYVKVVIGIYIMFITLNPILELLNYDFEIDDFFELQNIQVSSNYDPEMVEVYVLGIEQTIKEEIENLGYDVENVSVFLDDTYENIEKIELEISGKAYKIKSIEKVVIGENKKNVVYYEEIIQFLKENYGISEDNIVFK
jgi:stage III sporulation protein AF